MGSEILLKLSNLFKKKFIRDLLSLQISSVFLNVVAVLGSIVYARFLGVESYAQYALVFAFLGVVNLFANWGEQGVAFTIGTEAYARKDKKSFKEAIIYYFFITTFSTVTASMVAFIVAPLATKILYHDAAIGSFARVVIIMNVLQIVFLALMTVLQVVRKIRPMVIVENLNKISFTFVPVVFVMVGLGLWGLLYGKLLAVFIFMIISVIVYLKLRQKNDFVPSIHNLIFGIRFSIIKKYFSFSFTSSIEKFLGNLINAIPMLLLGYFGTLNGVAFYKIGYSYISLPLILFGQVARLLSVQLPQSNAYGRHILKRDFWRSTIASGFINFGLVIIFVLMAKPLILLFYGKEYLDSFRIVILSSAVVVLSGFSIGFGSFFYTMKRLKLLAGLGLMNLVIIISGFLIFYFLGADTVSAIIFSQIILGVIDLIVYFYLINKILRD